ncbi:MAG: hypothetical protein R3D59_06590 [Paracoccaceae bacterium]
MHRFVHLKTAVSLVLVFIGAKVIGAELLGIEKVPAVLSLGVTALLLGGGVALSLWQTRRPGPAVSLPAPARPE